MASQPRHQEIRAFLLPMEGGEHPRNISFLFTQNQVAEVLGRRTIYRIPFCPSSLVGIIAYQGQPLPVIDVNGLFGRPLHGAPTLSRQLMIVRTGAADPGGKGTLLKAAIMATTAVRTVKLSPQAMATGFIPQQAPDCLAGSTIVRGFFQWEEEYIAVLHLDQVVLGTSLPFSAGGSDH